MKTKALFLGLALAALVMGGCSENPGELTSDPPVGSPDSTPSLTDTDEAGACTYYPSGQAAKTVNGTPDSNPPSTGSVTITLHMSGGDVTMTFDRSPAPCAVGSFEFLASQGYFNATTCHRFVDGFVLQCGDPLAQGFGGPGYRFDDELSGTETYPYGTVAMANSGPNSNGSQFFIVIGQSVNLPPDYVVLGTVDPASMATIETNIVAHGGVDPTDPNGSAPRQGGDIISVTVD